MCPRFGQPCQGVLFCMQGWPEGQAVHAQLSAILQVCHASWFVYLDICALLFCSFHLFPKHCIEVPSLQDLSRVPDSNTKDVRYMPCISWEGYPTRDAWSSLWSRSGMASHEAEPRSLFAAGTGSFPIYSCWRFPPWDCHVWLATQRVPRLWERSLCQWSSNSGCQRYFWWFHWLGRRPTSSSHGDASNLCWVRVACLIKRSKLLSAQYMSKQHQ